MRALALLAVALLLGCDAPAGEPASQTVSEPAARTVGNPYPSATEVRLFVETDYDAEAKPILSRPDGMVLTRAQRATFEAALRIEAMPDELDACFIPHHFFRYYNEEGKQIGEVAVCFCCAGVGVTPAGDVSVGEGEWVSADYAALERLVQSMGEPTDVAC